MGSKMFVKVGLPFLRTMNSRPIVEIVGVAVKVAEEEEAVLVAGVVVKVIIFS